MVKTTTEEEEEEHANFPTGFYDDPKKVEAKIRKLNCDVARKSRTQRKQWRKKYMEYLDEPHIINRLNSTTKCAQYLKEIKEKKYTKLVPIAFSIAVHHVIGVFEMTLKLLFRPYHSFCVHVDQKAKELNRNAVETIVECYKKEFPNTTIFMAEDPLEVDWGAPSVLEADLKCIRQLRDNNKDWEYVINLAGSSFPLRTVNELESVLKHSAKGQSAIPQAINLTSIGHVKRLTETMVKHGYIPSKHTAPIPFNLPWGLVLQQGNKEGFFSRDFANYLLDAKISHKFLEILKATKVFASEEFYFSSLATQYYNFSKAHLYTISPREAIKGMGWDPWVRICTRLTYWRFMQYHVRVCRCPLFHHSICNLNLCLVTWALESECFFVNKLDTNNPPTGDANAIVCLYQHLKHKEAKAIIQTEQ